jgi:hypothetical protein
MKDAEARKWQTHGDYIGGDVTDHHRCRRVRGKELRHIEDLGRDRMRYLRELLALECLGYWQLDAARMCKSVSEENWSLQAVAGSRRLLLNAREGLVLEKGRSIWAIKRELPDDDVMMCCSLLNGPRPRPTFQSTMWLSIA